MRDAHPGRPFRAQSVFIDNQHFARFDLADELGVDQIERACFRREHICAIDFSEGERSPAERIAHAMSSRSLMIKSENAPSNPAQRRKDISTIVRRLR
jgi:hypothetical protein